MSKYTDRGDSGFAEFYLKNTGKPPSYFDATSQSIMIGTLGNAEAEWAAWLIIRLLETTGDTWRPFTLPEFAKLMEDDEETSRRVLIMPDFRKLIDDGHVREITPGDPKGGGEVTGKFIEAMLWPNYRRRK